MTAQRIRTTGSRVEVRNGHAWVTVGYIDRVDADAAEQAIATAIAEAELDAGLAALQAMNRGRVGMVPLEPEHRNLILLALDALDEIAARTPERDRIANQIRARLNHPSTTAPPQEVHQ